MCFSPWVRSGGSAFAYAGSHAHAVVLTRRQLVMAPEPTSCARTEKEYPRVECKNLSGAGALWTATHACADTRTHPPNMQYWRAQTIFHLAIATIDSSSYSEKWCCKVERWQSHVRPIIILRKISLRAASGRMFETCWI